MLRTSFPLGMGIPASWKSSLAWCSNSFMASYTSSLVAVPGPVRPQKLFLGRNHLRDEPRYPCDVQEVLVGEVLVDVVPGPAPASHRERKVQAVVEATPVAEDLDLVD